MHTPKIIYIMLANAYLCLDPCVFGHNHIPQELPVVPYPLLHGRHPFRRVALLQSSPLHAAVLGPAVPVPFLYPFRCEHINLKLRQKLHMYMTFVCNFYMVHCFTHMFHLVASSLWEGLRSSSRTPPLLRFLPCHLWCPTVWDISQCI